MNKINRFLLLFAIIFTSCSSNYLEWGNDVCPPESIIITPPYVELLFLGTPTIEKNVTSPEIIFNGIKPKSFEDYKIFIGAFINYPKVEASEIKEGIEIIELKIDEKGSLEHIKVVQSLGKAFDETVINAFKKFSYEPSYRNGIPMKNVLRACIKYNYYTRKSTKK